MNKTITKTISIILTGALLFSNVTYDASALSPTSIFQDSLNTEKITQIGELEAMLHMKLRYQSKHQSINSLEQAKAGQSTGNYIIGNGYDENLGLEDTVLIYELENVKKESGDLPEGYYIVPSKHNDIQFYHFVKIDGPKIDIETFTKKDYEQLDKSVLYEKLVPVPKRKERAKIEKVRDHEIDIDAVIREKAREGGLSIIARTDPIIEELFELLERLDISDLTKQVEELLSNKQLFLISKGSTTLNFTGHASDRGIYLVEGTGTELKVLFWEIMKYRGAPQEQEPQIYAIIRQWEQFRNNTTYEPTVLNNISNIVRAQTRDVPLREYPHRAYLGADRTLKEALVNTIDQLLKSNTLPGYTNEHIAIKNEIISSTNIKQVLLRHGCKEVSATHKKIITRIIKTFSKEGLPVKNEVLVLSVDLTSPFGHIVDPSRFSSRGTMSRVFLSTDTNLILMDSTVLGDRNLLTFCHDIVHELAHIALSVKKNWSIFVTRFIEESIAQKMTNIVFNKVIQTKFFRTEIATRYIRTIDAEAPISSEIIDDVFQHCLKRVSASKPYSNEMEILQKLIDSKWFLENSSFLELAKFLDKNKVPRPLADKIEALNTVLALLSHGPHSKGAVYPSRVYSLLRELASEDMTVKIINLAAQLQGAFFHTENGFKDEILRTLYLNINRVRNNILATVIVGSPNGGHAGETILQKIDEYSWNDDLLMQVTVDLAEKIASEATSENYQVEVSINNVFPIYIKRLEAFVANKILEEDVQRILESYEPIALGNTTITQIGELEAHLLIKLGHHENFSGIKLLEDAKKDVPAKCLDIDIGNTLLKYRLEKIQKESRNLPNGHYIVPSEHRGVSFYHFIKTAGNTYIINTFTHKEYIRLNRKIFSEKDISIPRRPEQDLIDENRKHEIEIDTAIRQKWAEHNVVALRSSDPLVQELSQLVVSLRYEPLLQDLKQLIDTGKLYLINGDNEELEFLGHASDRGIYIVEGKGNNLPVLFWELMKYKGAKQYQETTIRDLVRGWEQNKTDYSILTELSDIASHQNRKVPLREYPDRAYWGGMEETIKDHLMTSASWALGYLVNRTYPEIAKRKEEYIRFRNDLAETDNIEEFLLGHGCERLEGPYEATIANSKELFAKEGIPISDDVIILGLDTNSALWHIFDPSGMGKNDGLAVTLPGSDKYVIFINNVLYERPEFLPFFSSTLIHELCHTVARHDSSWSEFLGTILMEALTEQMTDIMADKFLQTKFFNEQLLLYFLDPHQRAPEEGIKKMVRIWNDHINRRREIKIPLEKEVIKHVNKVIEQWRTGIQTYHDERNILQICINAGWLPNKSPKEIIEYLDAIDSSNRLYEQIKALDTGLELLRAKSIKVSQGSIDASGAQRYSSRCYSLVKELISSNASAKTITRAFTIETPLFAQINAIKPAIQQAVLHQEKERVVSIINKVMAEKSNIYYPPEKVKFLLRKKFWDERMLIKTCVALAATELHQERFNDLEDLENIVATIYLDNIEEFAVEEILKETNNRTKGSPAEALRSISGNADQFGNNAFTIAELQKKRLLSHDERKKRAIADAVIIAEISETYSTTTVRKELEILQAVGIVESAGKKGKFKLYRPTEGGQRLMKSPERLEAVINIPELGQYDLYDKNNLLREDAIKILRQKVGVYLSFEMLPYPIIEKEKTLVHVICSDLIKDYREDIDTIFKSRLSKLSGDLGKNAAVKEKIIFVSKEELLDKIAELKGSPYNIVDVALPDDELLDSLPKDVKALIFRIDPTSEFVDLVGILGALRAVQNNDIPALLELFKILSGKQFDKTAELNTLNKEGEDYNKALAKLVVFDLPLIKAHNLKELMKMNEIVLEYLQAA